MAEETWHHLRIDLFSVTLALTMVFSLLLVWIFH